MSYILISISLTTEYKFYIVLNHLFQINGAYFQTSFIEELSGTFWELELFI